MAMARLAFVAVVAAGCYTSPVTPAGPLSNQGDAQGPAPITITRSRFGPIGKETPALLLPLRRAFAGYEVRPVHDSGLEYDIYLGGERLAYIVVGEDGSSIFNVHAVSGRIHIADRDWRVGATFRSASQLTECECWGEHPTCYRKGDRIAVNFERECADVTGGDPSALVALDGQRIARIVWSPTPFGGPANETNLDPRDITP